MLNKKKTKGFFPMIRSRHPSHNVLRTQLPKMPCRSVIRLGSITEVSDTISNGGNRIEINTINSVKNASNKKLMKECFTENGVITADWFTYSSQNMFTVEKDILEKHEIDISELPYPIVAKHIYGSRGNGNFKLNNQQELEAWMIGKTLSSYIFEKFYNYSREYRLHVTKDGCFYTCRKMLKSDTPEDKRWFRNDSNSVWILEENETFDKPVNWSDIEEHCVKALNSVGLDIGGCDVRIQSRNKSNGEQRESPEFIILEINSACSLGEITTIKYIDELPKIILDKYNNK